MSVFRDFQSAWAVRFPGCELPRAWEEDVRSNLTKHRTRVALLKEELEKEEFYVEYLERLLADVEKGRSTSNRGVSSSSSLTASNNKTSNLPPKASPRTSTANNSRTNSVSSVVSRESAGSGSADEQFVTVINVSSSGPTTSSSTSSSSVKERSANITGHHNKQQDNPLYQDSITAKKLPSSKSINSNKVSIFLLLISLVNLHVSLPLLVSGTSLSFNLLLPHSLSTFYPSS